MSELSEYFLNSKASIVELECIEISHSKFSQTYYIVRNAVRGITVTHEDDTEHDYEYYPMQLALSGSRDDLDQSLNVTFGDLGEVLPAELDNVAANDAFDENPVLRYRTYRSDNLTAPLYGPLLLQIKKISFNKKGATFEAKAPSLNVTRTGERYTVARFPMLDALL